MPLTCLMRHSSSACSTAVDHKDGSCSLEGVTNTLGSSPLPSIVVLTDPLLPPRVDGDRPQVCLNRGGLDEGGAGVGAGGGGLGASSSSSSSSWYCWCAHWLLS